VSPSRASIGTLEWAHRGGGRLSRSDRLRVVVEAMLVRLNALLRASQQVPISVDLASLRVPDSALCHSASELLASVSEAWLVNHCFRTFLWAAIVGKKEQRRFDEELLFVASALHDLGLTDAAAQLGVTGVECFAVEGAFAAEHFLTRQGVEKSRRDVVAEAISLHMNVRASLAHGVEAYLLHEGAALDVVGARCRDIAEPTRQELLTSYPRLEMKSRLVTLMKRQSSIRPHSRAGLLCRYGFISMIRRAPFES